MSEAPVILAICLTMEEMDRRAAGVVKQKPRKPLDEVVVIAGLDPASHP
jgi:hypothetical protein